MCPLHKVYRARENVGGLDEANNWESDIDQGGYKP